MIDARLSGNVLQNTTQIFSAPEHISAGQAWGPEDLTAYLTRVGYRPIQDDTSIGQFTVQQNTGISGLPSFPISAGIMLLRCNSPARASAPSNRSAAARN